MKKVFAVVILIVIVAGVGAPFVSGLVMENIVTKSHYNLNKMHEGTGSDLTFEIIQYDRHFSSSEIEWKINLGSLKAIYGIEDIVLVDRVKHGITGVVSVTSLEKNKWFSALLENTLQGKNPLHISTEYSLTGKIKSSVVLDAFSFIVDDEVFEIGSAEVITESNDELKKFKSKASWEGFAVPQKLKVDGVSFNYNLEMISTYIWDGNITFEINGSGIESPKGHFDFTNFKADYSLDFEKDDNTLSFGAEFGADSLAVGQQKLEDAFVRFGVEKLDAQGYEDFMRIYTGTVNDILGDMATLGDDPEKMNTIIEQQMAVVGFQMLAAYEKFMKKGLEIQISDLHVQLPLGKITGDVAVSLNKDMTIAEFVPLINQPELAMDIFSLQSDITIPAELAGDNAILLAPLNQGMQTGIFVKKGDKLVHKMRTKDGKLILNGEEVLLY